jgi:hypothetical protein
MAAQDPIWGLRRQGLFVLTDPPFLQRRTFRTAVRTIAPGARRLLLVDGRQVNSPGSKQSERLIAG